MKQQQFLEVLDRDEAERRWLAVIGAWMVLELWGLGAVPERFVRAEHRAMLLVDDDPARLLDALAAWRAPVVEKWLDQEES